MSSCRDVEMSTWVLLCTLAMTLLQRIPIPNEGLDDRTKICKEHVINNSFVKTTINRNSHKQVEYCNYTEAPSNAPIGMAKSNKTYKTLNLDKLIGIYKTLNLSNSYKHETPNSPLTETGVLTINDHQELPLYVRADIRRNHTLVYSNDNVGPGPDEQMALMGQLPTDDRVGLLPLSIGGSGGSNIVPMARNVHKKQLVSNATNSTTAATSPGNDDDDDDSSGSNLPLPFWESTADWIIAFLHMFPEGLVTWSVAVQYAQGVVTDPLRHRDYRPVGFTRQFSAYTSTNVSSLVYKSNQTTLLNNNNDTCGRHFKNPIPPVPQECKPSQSRGLGRLLSNNIWKETHVASYPFVIGKRTFFYSQCVNDRLTWFIQELLPRGKMGKRTDRGTRSFYYKTVFAYSINRTNYLYSHRGRGGTYWRIQQLLPGGKMGITTSEGNWKYSHRVSIPFIIENRWFFYGQVESINKWYIKELLPNGEIGNQTSNGYSIDRVVFIHQVGEKQFLYSHDTLLLTWNMRELLPQGRMGRLVKRGKWLEGHHTAVPYSIKGHHFFFAQNLYSGFSFIQEILPDEVMGDRIVGLPGGEDSRYEIIFEYSVNGSHFMYAHNQRTREWIIRKLYLDV